MDTEDKLRDIYQSFRTFMRTLDTRALEKKVIESDMDIVNRWKALETAEGRVPGCSMQQHYTQLELRWDLSYSIPLLCNHVEIIIFG